MLFQSTLPVRGATTKCIYPAIARAFQSTLPVRGATFCHLPLRAALTISIHAPRAGSDPRSSRRRKSGSPFQSTLPVRGATAKITKFLGYLWQKYINLAHNFGKSSFQISERTGFIPFFSTKVVRTCLGICVCLGFAGRSLLKNQRIIGQIGGFAAEMLDPFIIPIS